MHSSFHQMIILFLFCITFAYSTVLPETRLLCREHEIGIYDDLKESNHEVININISVPSNDWFPNECKRLERTRNIAKRSLKLKNLKNIFKLGKKFYKRKVGNKGFEKVLAGSEIVTEFLDFQDSLSSDDEEEESVSLKEAFRNILNGGGMEHLTILEPNLIERLDKEFSMNLNWISVVKLEITDVRCSRKSEEIELTSKFPIFEIVTVKRCFDLGEVTDNQYQHYEFPWTTSHLIENYSVHLSKCISKNGLVICAKSALIQPKCVPNNLEMCIPYRSPFAEKDVRIFRKLPHGMVVYGDVQFIVFHNNGIKRPHKTEPFQLYYITAKNTERIEFGSVNEPGRNGNKPGKIRTVWKSSVLL